MSGRLLERRAVEREQWPSRARPRALALLALVGVIAILTLLGYVLDVQRMFQVTSGVQSMKVNTALALLLVAVSQVVVNPAVRRTVLGLVVVLAVLTLGQYLFSLDLGIDTLVFDDPAVTDRGGPPGRPSVLTAVALLSLVVSGLLAETHHRRWSRLGAQLAVLPAAVVGLVGGYGYWYEVPSLYSLAGGSSLAPQTAVSLVLLSLAMLYGVRLGVLQWVSFARDPGAALLRVLIPVALLVLPFVGWVLVESVRRGAMSAELQGALLVTLVAVLVIAVGLRAGLVALRADNERERVLDELAAVNQQLEERVRSRSAELNRQRTRVALLEDRDRIARDLHDRVIQRIFAAGLQVAGLTRTARKVAAGSDDLGLTDSLDRVAIELDMAIRELRNSIFELTSAASVEDLADVVGEVAARSARILGFDPAVTVEESLELAPELVATIAAVLQEALSNVARHARASCVDVTVRRADEAAEVLVADDGIGMPDPLPRTSGVSNIHNRAVALGGTASWEERDGGGTVLRWTVPA